MWPQEGVTERREREKDEWKEEGGRGWREGGENGSDTLTLTQPQWVRRITRCLLER